MDEEHPFVLGVSVRNMEANLQRSLQSNGVDVADPLMMAAAMMLMFAYDATPDPPVSPDAPLASAVAARAPADGVDRISRLPDVLLRSVVSRLPAKDAALASRWRGLWCSVPLTLVDAHILPRWISADRMILALAASRVLDAHPGPFRCVHLSRCHMASHQTKIERWLKLLAGKGVQELVFINRPWPIDHPLPRALFGCTSVTRLHLGLCRVPSTVGLPRATRFPHLQELVLSTVVIEDRYLHFLIDRSPALEVLTVITSQAGTRVRLVSRSLRCVQVGMSTFVDITVVDTPRLERLFVSMLSPSARDRCSRIKIGHAPNLLVLGYWQPGLELETGNTILKVGAKMSPNTMVPSIKILAFEVGFEVRNKVKMVPCFLKCFPNVETLHVFSRNDAPSGKVDPKFWHEAGYIDCVQRHVKKFIFQEFRGKRSELAFLKFIAERAQVLEKMVVMVASKCFSSADGVNAKLKPLTSAIWASKDCKLIVFKSPSSFGTSPPWASQIASNFSCRDPFDLLTFNAEFNSGASVLQHSLTL
ncbi:F-box/FBD/LRR-repeat protein At1g13570-like [Miscanthus floridulus]|uniref:F-box/FBD/LRR-repeat protein At1g13570-like n=1 Tax=Miscanthus floridulus TaxID=154761 RepID=UPI00345797B0